MSKLNQWAIGSRPTNPYQASELWETVIMGFVSEDSRFDEGIVITTSGIIGKREGKVVTRSGTEYELLEISKEYEAAYPNARERLFNSLPEV